MRMRIVSFFLLLGFVINEAFLPPPAFRCARLKYNGGGDWYNDPAAVPNLMKYIEQKTGMKTPKTEETIEPSNAGIFQYSFVFMTGHGTVSFSELERDNLRRYLEAGGFLYVDDDYGLDKSFREEVKKLFPRQDFILVPFSHPIYTIFYKFPNGFPKIHEHDGKPPETYGVFLNNRLVLLYTYETNPSDGWVETHDDPPFKREQSFQIGLNIVLTAITK